MTKKFSFVRPDELLLHDTKQPHGNTIYLYCQECPGTMMFNLDQKDGYCFSCGRVIKLHKMYKTTSYEELLDAFGVDLASSHYDGGRRPETVAREPETVARETEKIIPGPLSQHALTYIASRGISPQTLSVLPVLKEASCYGRQWLCWRNVAGSYELRSIGGSDKSMPRGSVKTYSQAVIRSETKQLVICEGIFSTLSYAQLFDYEPDMYVTLNSVSVKAKVVQDFPQWIACGVEQIILALDFDPQGRRATRALYSAMQGKISVRIEPFLLPKCDWNDQLMERQP
jgi:hypothetical protein